MAVSPPKNPKQIIDSCCLAPDSPIAKKGTTKSEFLGVPLAHMLHIPLWAVTEVNHANSKAMTSSFFIMDTLMMKTSFPC